MLVPLALGAKSTGPSCSPRVSDRSTDSGVIAVLDPENGVTATHRQGSSPKGDTARTDELVTDRGR